MCPLETHFVRFQGQLSMKEGIHTLSNFRISNDIKSKMCEKNLESWQINSISIKKSHQYVYHPANLRVPFNLFWVIKTQVQFRASFSIYFLSFLFLTYSVQSHLAVLYTPKTYIQCQLHFDFVLSPRKLIFQTIS